jgi:hypothetical protein
MPIFVGNIIQLFVKNFYLLINYWWFHQVMPMGGTRNYDISVSIPQQKTR